RSKRVFVVEFWQPSSIILEASTCSVWPPSEIRDASRLLHAPLRDESPDKENDNGADDGADEPCTLAGRIPSEGLAEKARNECAHDAEDCRQHETLGLVGATRHDELSDHAGDKPNDDRPDDTHGLLL